MATSNEDREDHNVPPEIAGEDLGRLIERLAQLSRDESFDPFRDIVWPERLAPEGLWMSSDLMSVYGTPHMSELSPRQLTAMSKLESVNFYSLNVHGIRELIMEVTARIHMPGFELASEFFHQFIREENEHMWYFARFCRNYGGKIYPDRQLKFDKHSDVAVASFVVFARILIFEEIVDYFNIRMANDASLDPLIRQINRLHHQDESRHIAFSRHIVKLLHKQLRETHNETVIDDLEAYLKRCFVAMIQSLYNPLVYGDAGIPGPYEFRAALLSSSERWFHHARWLKRIVEFMKNNEIIKTDEGIFSHAGY